MSQTEFKCKRRNCSENVSYERQIVLGLVTAVKEETAKTVYLTCAKGHTHPYEVVE